MAFVKDFDLEFPEMEVVVIKTKTPVKRDKFEAGANKMIKSWKRKERKKVKTDLRKYY